MIKLKKAPSFMG